MLLVIAPKFSEFDLKFNKVYDMTEFEKVCNNLNSTTVTENSRSEDHFMLLLLWFSPRDIDYNVL